MSDKAYNLDDLKYLMSRLRDPESGCPWDVKQDFASIVPHTLEEAYEVADAIAKQDWPHLEEELGDLLFQVIFYSQIGQERAYFDFDSVVNVLVTKLIRRHPHVFPDATLHSRRDPGVTPEEAEVKGRWDKIKELEKSASGKATVEKKSLLQDVPHALPALSRAQKIQKTVSKVGFDWPEISGVIDKIREELQEVEEELEAADPARLQHEVGDLLFAVVNLARHVGVNSEEALRTTNHRFEQRFEIVEDLLKQQGKALSENESAATIEDMEAAWQKAKQHTS